MSTTRRLLFGPFATYQLTRTAERSPALLLADVAVGWSMIAAGLIIADRRPGNRIGPLAILTGFAWFVGDFTNSDVAVVAYLAILAHGWFDPFSRWSSWPTRRAGSRAGSIARWLSASSSSRLA